MFPSKRGSIGDEAMAIAVSAQLRESGCKRIALISYSPDDSWHDILGFDEIKCRPSGWPFRWFSFCRWLAKYDALGIIGADVLDGYYSAARSRSHLFLAQISERLGLRTVLLGFSYRATPDISALKMLQRCGGHIAVLCRDPQSLIRVRALAGVVPIQVADLAFALQPNVDSPRVLAFTRWTLAQKSDGARVFGVNCNRQALGHWRPADCDHLVTAYADALSGVSANHPNLSLVLVPHDSRGKFSDEILCRRIFEKLNEDTKKRTYLIADVWTAAEIKAAAALLDGALSGRMHFAIACLGSGTPVASFEYQDKFSGLYELFGLPDLCVPGAQSGQSEIVEALIENLLRRVDGLKAHVRAKLPEIRQLSMRNVRALLGESVE